jgi:hypothetical protein
MKFFDYTSEEWEAINIAVCKARSDELSGTEQRALQLLANEYLGERDRRERGKYAETAALQSRWAKVAAQCRKLKALLEATVAVSDDPDKPWLILDQSIFGSPEALSTAQVTAFLDELRTDAEINKILLLKAHPQVHSFSRRKDPGVVFQQQILWLWTHQFGGDLSFAYDKASDPERPYGPLVEYLRSVTGPVMGCNAPAPSGLRSLINRQKSFYVWLEQSGAEVTPLGMQYVDRLEKMEEGGEVGQIF